MSPRQVTLLAALAAIWGGSYLLIKYALEGFSAPAIVFARCLLAALVLFGALRATGGAAAPRVALADARSRPRTALLLGATAVAIPFTLITLGELEVPSGLTAVLISPASLFVALLAPFIDPTESLDRRQALGTVMGLGGVALVVGVESVQTLAEFLGALAMIAAAAFYGLSSFVVKGAYRALSSMQTSFVSVSVAAILTLPAAIATAPSEAPGARAVLAVLALGAVGTALAFVIFYKLIAEVGAGRASLVSYLAPGVALFYGALLLDETITVAAVGGLVLILAGVALASRRRPGAAAAKVSPPGSAAPFAPSPRPTR
jgi:drug/metabolite transporter (DMT)-like permease